VLSISSPMILKWVNGLVDTIGLMAIKNDEIDWSPASSFGANFCTHRLVKGSAGRLEFEPN